jgi:hypothetical protein
LRKTTTFWLRTVSASAAFAYAFDDGRANSTGANYPHDVRPYFLLA